MDLRAAIIRYFSTKVVFENCKKQLASNPRQEDSAEFKRIADEFFEAKTTLELMCYHASEPLAQEYATKAKLAAECSQLMLDHHVLRVEECSRRMAEFAEVEERLLNSF